MIPREEAIAYILQAHGLGSERHPDPASAMRAVVAVQTQYPASLGPALAARSNGAGSSWIESALGKDRTLLKAWNLRCTLHTALAEDHMLLLAALGSQFLKRFQSWSSYSGFTPETLESQHRQILEALAPGPLGRRELHDAVPAYKNLPMVGWGLDVMGLALEGKIVLAHQAASNTRFTRLDLWAPHLTPCPLEEDEAIKEMMRRYFRSYGPATFQDFLIWSGLRTSRPRKLFQSVLAEMMEVEIEGKKGLHYLHSSIAAPSGFSFPLRLLPKFDPLIMGHRDRSLILPDQFRTRVLRPAGQVEAVVLAEGQVRGTWRTLRKGGCLEFVVEPFGKFKKAWLVALPKEARRAAGSLGFREASVTVVD